MVNARVVRLQDLSSSDVDAWRALAAHAAEPNPFFEPEFVLPAARHRHDASIDLLMAWDGSDLSFAAPVRTTARWRKIPARSVSTWIHPHCFLATPLLHPDPEVGERSWRAISEVLGASSLRFAAFERMASDGAVADAMRRALPGREVAVYETAERAVIRRNDGVAPSLGRVLSGRHRREMTRRGRLLAEERGGAAVTRDVSGDGDEVAHFLALERSGWKGRASSALAVDPASEAFVRDLVEGFASRDRFHLLALETPAGMAAAVCILRARDVAFLWKMGFDESLATRSPGTQLIADVLEWFDADPTLAMVDSCAAPENDFANRMFPDRRSISALLIPFDRVGRVIARRVPAIRARMRTRTTR